MSAPQMSPRKPYCSDIEISTLQSYSKPRRSVSRLISLTAYSYPLSDPYSSTILSLKTHPATHVEELPISKQSKSTELYQLGSFLSRYFAPRRTFFISFTWSLIFITYSFLRENQRFGSCDCLVCYALVR